MRRFLCKIKSVWGNKCFCFLIGMAVLICFLLSWVVSEHGHDFVWHNVIKMFLSMRDFVWIATLFLFVMYVTGIGSDFINGFRLAFSGRKNISRMELQKAAKAMELAGKIVVTECVFICVIETIPLLYELSIPLDQLGPLLSTVLLSIAYSALVLLIVMPLRVKLEGMVISFMVEPDKEAEESAVMYGQTVYFKLRALGLTDREAEVARLVCCGLANKEIGEMLYISDTTVKKHMTHILEKTGCMDREALTEKVKTL